MGEPVDAAMRVKIVERVCAALNEHYVFPEVAKKMEASLRQKLKAGVYDKLGNSAEDAASKVTGLTELYDEVFAKRPEQGGSVAGRAGRRPLSGGSR